MPSRFGSASRYDRRGVTGAAYRPGLPPGLDLDALNKELKRQRDAEAAAASALTKTGRRAAKRAAKAADASRSRLMAGHKGKGREFPEGPKSKKSASSKAARPVDPTGMQPP